MCSLLSRASRLCLYHGRSHNISNPQWQRSAIHLWHHIRDKTLYGQQHFLAYEQAEIPDSLESEIKLWQGKKEIGLLPFRQVIEDYLGPGQSLVLKTDPDPEGNAETRIAQAVDARHYEVLALKRTKRTTPIPKAKGYRAKEVYLTPLVEPATLQHFLTLAYMFLDTERTTPAQTFPVECHIKTRKKPAGRDWLQFSGGRFDLHPAAILRAMPEGSFEVLKPQASTDHKDLVWVMAPNGYKNKTPLKLVDEIQRQAANKKKVLTKLMAKGDITADGMKAQKSKSKPGVRRPKSGSRFEKADSNSDDWEFVRKLEDNSFR